MIRPYLTQPARHVNKPAEAIPTGQARVVIDALTKHGCPPWPSGRGAWWYLCPVHHGTTSTVQIIPTSDGSCTLGCRDGCNAFQITKAIGLTLNDLLSRDWQKRAVTKGGAR